MLDIESSLGLLKNLPKEVLSKLNISSSFLASDSKSEIEVVIISGDNVDNISQTVDNLGGSYLNLGYNFGIVRISVDKIVDLALVPTIQYIEFPKNLYTTDFESNRASCVTQVSKANGLNGRGIIVGFLDTGIDYTHPAFRNVDGTSRVEYIYDLSLGGTIYNNAQINQALSSGNPYDIVPSRDDAGHGTHVAGIACAGGNINSKYYGVAPESSIMMVKVARGLFTLSTEIMKGLKFLVDRSKELNMPLVINISLSTNDGAHNGSSLLEQYISTVATVERVTIVIAAGNEGDAAHHVGGMLQSENEIYFNIASDESIVVINLFKSVLPQINLEITCPCGQKTGIIDLSEGTRSGTIGNSRYEIYITGPKPFDISGEIGIILTGLNEFVSSGQWKITLRRSNEYKGNFDMWLPISEGLNINTKFLNPTIYNTLGIPATVNNIISVGSYNYILNNISPFTGRGERYEGQYIKPDVVAPGEGIYSSIPNRSFDRKSGTSMATPHVSGIAALLSQWGIVQRNDPYLYGERLKYFLVIGAKKGRRDIAYPDPAWGYGEVCLLNSLRLVAQDIGVGLRGIEARQQESEDSTAENVQQTQESEASVLQPSQDANNTSAVNLSGTQTGAADVAEMNSELEGNTTITTDENSEKANLAIGVRVKNREEFNNIISKLNINGILLTDTFGILIIRENQLDEVRRLNVQIEEEDLELIFTLNEISPVEASGAAEFNNNPYLRLNGQGVFVGIIDTGIDYLSNEFTREDDTSRIFRLWDQTIEGDKAVEGLKYGSEYTEEQITEAVKAKINGEDPYAIVPSRDEIGHGTMVAGIVGGRGKNVDLVGVAPDCEFIIVKLDRALKYELANSYVDTDIPTYTSWKIVLAIRYVINIASQYGRPIVIYLPLGSNFGSHEGTSIVSSVINSYIGRSNLVFVTTTGNQGNTETHTEGMLENDSKVKDIELQVGRNQRILPIEIWINQANIVELSIISPAGEIIGNITSKLSRNQVIKFFDEQTTMVINYISPEEQTGDNLIIIKASNLKEGIWRFRLSGTKLANGKYNAWIPQRELINSDTKFLQPISDTTLTVPSTAEVPLSVAYYNQSNDAVMVQSGRGYTRDGKIKPEIAAGGFNATVLVPGGGMRVVSGASIAGAVVTGGCALILQWAVVKGNDPNINEKKIRSYIVGGARRREGDVYPNKEWGYGMFDLKGTFDVIKDIFAPEEGRKSIDYDEYNVGNLFIRKPINN